IGDLLEDRVAVTGGKVTPTWVSAAFIDEQKLDVPIWAPPTGEYAGVPFVNGEKAASQGLRNRPVRETARDLIRWWKTLPEERTGNIRAGVTLEREAEAMALWHQRNA
ncbi:MAG: epimerase, partial [Woeseiaceae bacterium]